MDTVNRFPIVPVPSYNKSPTNILEFTFSGGAQSIFKHQNKMRPSYSQNRHYFDKLQQRNGYICQPTNLCHTVVAKRVKNARISRVRSRAHRLGIYRLVLRGAGDNGENHGQERVRGREENASEGWVLPKRRRLLHPRILPSRINASLIEIPRNVSRVSPIQNVRDGSFASTGLECESAESTHFARLSTPTPPLQSHSMSATSTPLDSLPGIVAPATTAASSLPPLHWAAANGRFWDIAKLVDQVCVRKRFNGNGLCCQHLDASALLHPCVASGRPKDRN